MCYGKVCISPHRSADVAQLRVIGSASKMAHSSDWQLVLGCQLEAQPELKGEGHSSSPQGSLHAGFSMFCLDFFTAWGLISKNKHSTNPGQTNLYHELGLEVTEHPFCHSHKSTQIQGRVWRAHLSVGRLLKSHDKKADVGWDILLWPFCWRLIICPTLRKKPQIFRTPFSLMPLPKLHCSGIQNSPLGLLVL